jgi:hypothetical protein
LLAHQPGHRELQLAAVDDHDGVHRELRVLAGVIDVQMGVQDEPNVGLLHPMLGELLLHALLAVVEALHPQVAHDLGMAESRIDDDRGLTAADQKPEYGYLDRHPAVVPQDEEARLEFDVPQVEDLDLKTHLPSLRSSALLSKRGSPDSRRSRVLAGAGHRGAAWRTRQDLWLLDGREITTDPELPPGAGRHKRPTR